MSAILASVLLSSCVSARKGDPQPSPSPMASLTAEPVSSAEEETPADDSQSEEAETMAKLPLRAPAKSGEISYKLSTYKIKNGSVMTGMIRFHDGELPKMIRAEFEGIHVPVFADGEDGVYQCVFGIPLDRSPGPAKLVVRYQFEEGREQSRTILFFVTRADLGPISKINVAAKYVTPPEEVGQRIVAEQKEIGEIYRTVTAEKLWRGRFKLPVNTLMLSAFGKRRIYNGVPKAPHPGTDFRAPIGTPIRSPAGGRVALAKDLYFTGNTVILDHGYGIYTLYAHMSALKVKKGDEVKPRQLLGLAGKTGRAEGPHLHWGAIIQGVKVNPVDLTKVMQ